MDLLFAMEHREQPPPFEGGRRRPPRWPSNVPWRRASPIRIWAPIGLRAIFPFEALDLPL